MDPAEEFGAALSAARDAGDQPGYLRTLCRGDLLLPLAVDDAGAPAWAGTEVAGRRLILAFTSRPAMVATLGADRPCRRARFVELARSWPDPAAWLAVDPGQPIETYLPANLVAELAELADRPADDGELALGAAGRSGDAGALVSALLEDPLVVPLDPALGGVRDPADPAFPWWRLELDARPIAVYTSAERLRDQLGEQDWIAAPFGLLVRCWPGPAIPMAINPGSAFGALLDGTVLRRLAGVLVELPHVSTMDVQVVVMAAQVARYLEFGHARVAGLIHRRPAGEVPIGELYRRLGLLGSDSPFGSGDEFGYLIRWLAADPDDYRDPRMDGRAVPAGAALVRVHRSGAETVLARYGGDGWVAG